MGRKKKDSEQSVERCVAPDHLVGLINAAESLRSKKAEFKNDFVDGFDSKVASAVENGHLHRKAFNEVKKLDAMDEFRRNDFIRSFQLYVDILTEKRWSKEGHSGDLVDTAEEHDEDAEAAEQNAAALEKGIKQLEPEAEFDDATSSKPSRRRHGGVGEAPGTTRVQ
jgi:hypothetical protein